MCKIHYYIEFRTKFVHTCWSCDQKQVFVKIVQKWVIYIKLRIRYEEILLQSYAGRHMRYQKKGLDPRINPG